MLNQSSTLILASIALAAFVSANPVNIKRQGGSAGCGTSHTPGFNNNTANHTLGDRTYAVLVPVNYDSSRSYPLIVDYHGNHGTPYKQYITSQYDKFDTEGNFLVVYPQGVDESWEGAPYNPGADDLTFTTNLVQHMIDNYCVDPNRVYGSGKSNGGGFVGTLACSNQGEQFAAFAMSSAALYTDNLGGIGDWGCTPSRPLIPIMEVHGSADGTILYSGGIRTFGDKTGQTPPIPDWLDAWGTTRDDEQGPHVDYPSSQFGALVNVTTYTFDDQDKNPVAAVTGVWISGMDHCWASTEPNNDWTIHGDAACKAPLNATSLFLDFFNSWDINGYTGS